MLVELLLAIFELCPLGARAIRNDEWNESFVLDDSREGDRERGREAFNSPVEGAENVGGGVRRYTRKMKEGDDEGREGEIISEERKNAAHEFVKSLLRGPPDLKEEMKVGFIRQSHKSRDMKVWVGEVSDVARDYFWLVFFFLFFLSRVGVFDSWSGG